VIAVSGGNCYKITASDGTFSQITIDDTNFQSSERVTFADFGTDLYAANGGKIKKIPSAGNIIDIADADAPTSVSHVAYLDRYLLATEDGTANFHWSDVNAPGTWGGNYAQAEAIHDDLAAMVVAHMELCLMGKKTLEIWHDDGSTPFMRLPQGYIQRGTVAGHTFKFCDAQDTFLWLDQNRQVVMLQGRTPVPLSLTMTKYIQGFTSVSDAIGDYMEIAGRPYYILHFPAEEETIVYDFTSAKWYTWAYWNSGGAVYERWRGNCYCLAPAWNESLVGDRANGKVYTFDVDTYSDDGDTIRSLVRTGHYNHGTEDRLKFSNSLTFRVKRTNVVSVDSTPDLIFKYRDNGETSWTAERTVSLQQVGNTEFRAKVNRLGRYYSRQWEFYLTDDFPLCLVSVEENVDIEQ